jgi:uncharacterized protein YacL
MTFLPILAFLGGIGAAFLIFPFWSSAIQREKKKEKKEGGALLLDLSALLDPRLIDLSASGLLDKRLLVPETLLRALSQAAMSEDEAEKNRARKGLEHFRRLEAMIDLDLKIIDEAHPKIGDHVLETVFLPKAINAHLLISDSMSQERGTNEGVRVINLHQVAQAFRSPIQAGEKLSVRIQRIGKESGQGVGYLEDGTMVVVNGAASSVGEMVEAFVLSVKHNTAGRMVFCNTIEEHAKFTAEIPERRRLSISR